ncbi:DUF2218 domain-containing protein [Spirillospora sp. CA-142024]|uniref:DUF2218 domain-containing protein n=1 Tax=Spirillospora sp. CA-142024 TaxID=3240036 RepID=UPI003D8AF28D
MTVLSAQAHVQTQRAGRYLTQLGKHSHQMSLRTFHKPHRPGTPPKVQNAEWSDTDAMIDFGWGRCTLRATATELILRAEATDQERLQQIQNGIAARLERIGRRDQLTVTWHQETPPPLTSSQTSAPPRQEPLRRHFTTALLAAAIVLVIALHLSLGGALLADQRWTNGAIGIAIVAALMKAVILGRVALRRRKDSQRNRLNTTADTQSGHRS